MSSRIKNKPDSEYYIRVIDDTAKPSPKKQTKIEMWGFVIIFGPSILLIIYYIISLILQLWMSESDAANNAMIIASLVTSVIVCFIFIKMNGKKTIQNENRSSMIMVDKNEYETILELLEKNGSINASKCSGFIVSGMELARIHLAMITVLFKKYENKNCTFIRTNCDIDKFKDIDKKLVEKIFGYDENDNVIWFSKKNVVKVLYMSMIQALSFRNKDGKKSYFCYNRYINFHDNREILIEGGDCVMHIRT